MPVVERRVERPGTARSSIPWLLAALPLLVLQGFGCVGPGLEPPGQDRYAPGGADGSGGIGNGAGTGGQVGDGDDGSNAGGLDLGESPLDAGLTRPDAGLDTDGGS